MKRVDVITLREVETGNNIGTIITEDLTEFAVENLMMNAFEDYFDCSKDEILLVEDRNWKAITEEYKASFDFMIEVDNVKGVQISVEKSWLY